jgi:serine/threonine protein kinase
MAASRTPDYLLGDRYRLKYIIASGGMADVWCADDTKLHREVAVKMLREKVASQEGVARRFQREARALATLVHPNIVPVYDVVEDNGTVALVMRLIEGKSLRDLLDDAAHDSPDGKGVLSVHLTVHIGRSIAAALAKAHKSEIVHRDIKPGNILVMANGDVLLTDFGIAKSFGSAENDETDLTRADIMMGTAKYLSPEQVNGKPLDGRADIYALGLVLYECLAGRVPFKGENDQQTAIARLQRDPTPLNGLRSDVPSTVVNVIHKMLRRKPEHRYQTCEEVEEALEKAIQHVHDAVTPVDGVNSASGSRRTVPVDPLMAVNNTPARGQQAVRPQRDNTPRTHAPRNQAPSDKTPKGTAKPTSTLPPRQRTSTKRNYIPIVSLIVTAVIMAILLWNGLQHTKSATIGPSGGKTVAVEHVSVTAMHSYDPNGDDHQENEAMIPALTDNNPDTSWTTVCYGDKYFGSKGGVGIVMTLSGLGTGQVKANFLSKPWSAEVYGISDTNIPSSIDGWGLRLADNYGTENGQATFNVTTPVHSVLFLLREIGRSTTCSNSNPYKGILSELNFVSN